LVVECQDVVLKEEEGYENELFVCSNDITFIPPPHGSWYSDMIYLLHHGTCPNHMNLKERMDLKLKSA
jgi:hypothetical protein